MSKFTMIDREELASQVTAELEACKQTQSWNLSAIRSGREWQRALVDILDVLAEEGSSDETLQKSIGQAREVSCNLAAKVAERFSLLELAEETAESFDVAEFGFDPNSAESMVQFIRDVRGDYWSDSKDGIVIDVNRAHVHVVLRTWDESEDWVEIPLLP